jgi:hypothetical protein
MTLSTLKKLERGFYALMISVEKEMKTDSHAKQLHTEYCKQWSHWNDIWKAAAVLAARRKDKWEELFTLFVPDRHSLRVITCTPRLIISQTHWRRGYEGDPYQYQTHGEPHIDVQTTRFYNPEWHFKYHMTPRN